MTPKMCLFCERAHIDHVIIEQMLLQRPVPRLCTCQKADCRCGEILEQYAIAHEGLCDGDPKWDPIRQMKAEKIREGVFVSVDDMVEMFRGMSWTGTAWTVKV